MNHNLGIHHDRTNDHTKRFKVQESEQEIDQILIAAIRMRDRNAFGQLYRRHTPWMMALAYRILQNQGDAEDLLHDVLIEVWDKAATYDPQRGSVRSWLAVRTRSRALDRIRALKWIRKNQSEESASDHLAMESTETLENELDRSFARGALDSLSPKQRSVLQMNYFQGLTCQEIAERNQIPLGTVKSRLSTALRALRSYLKSTEDPSSCS